MRGVSAGRCNRLSRRSDDPPAPDTGCAQTPFHNGAAWHNSALTTGYITHCDVTGFLFVIFINTSHIITNVVGGTA